MTLRLAAFLGAVLLVTSLLTACGLSPVRSAAQADPITESDQSPARRRALIRLELADAYLQRGQAMVALDELKQVLLLSPELPAAWTLRGLAYVQLGDPKRALDSLDRAFELAPDDGDVLHNRGWLLCQQASSARTADEAQALLRRALDRPGYRHADRSWLALAACQERVGQPSQALQSLSRLAGEPAGQPQTLWQAARLARKLDNPQLVSQLGLQLRTRFGQSPQAAAFDKGSWDE